MDNSVLEQLVTESIKQLDTVMDVSAKDRAKRLAKHLIRGTKIEDDPMFWPAGLLMLGLKCAKPFYGLVTASHTDRSGVDMRLASQQSSVSTGSEASQNGVAVNISANDIASRIDAAIAKHVEVWRTRYMGRISFVDDALAFYSLLGDERYEADCRKMAEFLYTAPKDASGCIIYNADAGNDYVFADGVGQTSMFLSAYGVRTGDSRALALAMTQLRAFRKYGMDQAFGMPYHGYSLSEGDRAHGANLPLGAGEVRSARTALGKGILGWGRAYGWLLMGLSEYVCCLKERSDPELRDWYIEMCRSAWPLMREDGGFGWQIIARNSHGDTSATGMIMYSVARGIQEGILDAGEFKDMLVEAMPYILDNIVDGKVGGALSACEDFAVHYQTFGAYPWGQGAILAAAAQMSLVSAKINRKAPMQPRH